MRMCFFCCFLAIISIASAQSRFPENQISLNGFRNPSIGIEYQRKQLSVHGGYYITTFKSGITTKFIKAGITYWFLPFGKKGIPSSLYLASSYLYGLNLDYKGNSAVAVESGIRWLIWKGLQFRLGIIGITSKDKSFKINPTPSINYSFKW